MNVIERYLSPLQLWEREPDKKVFTYRNIQCEINRHEYGKHLCGYVYLKNNNKNESIPVYDLDCHGGVTYCKPLNDYIIIGFDCGHCNDYMPGFKFKKREDETYRSMTYVEDNLKQLVDQIIDVYGGS